MAISKIMCFGSSKDPEAEKSKEIERQLREDEKKLAKEVKLLLLGRCNAVRAIERPALTDVNAQVRESLESRPF